MLRRVLLWLSAASGVYLMVLSLFPIAHYGEYEQLTFIERGDPFYSRSQISLTVAPLFVFFWAGLITVLMVITVVLPMQGSRAEPLSTSDKAFTIAAIIYMVAPMALLTWFAIWEGSFYRSIAYHYLPWYVPLLIAGLAVYSLTLIGVLAANRRITTGSARARRAPDPTPAP